MGGGKQDLGRGLKIVRVSSSLSMKVVDLLNVCNRSSPGFFLTHDCTSTVERVASNKCSSSVSTHVLAEVPIN